MKISRFLAAGLVASSAFAQDANPNPLYLGATLVSNQGDLLSYAGGKKTSHAFEFGYALLAAEESGIGTTVYGRYMRTTGKKKYPLGVGTPGTTDYPTTGVAFALDTATVGLDLTFATPLKGFVPYAGLNVNFFDGSKTDNFRTPKRSFEDSKAKLGVRVGFQYSFSHSWSMAMDYNFTEWRAVGTDTRLKGYNPVNPSWVGLTVRYNFSYK